MPQLSNKITFTDEQAMLLDIATNFFREKSPTVTVRRQIASESGFDRGLWGEIAELGWLGIAVPERFGGSGLSLADVTVIVEPMGRHLAGTPFTPRSFSFRPCRPAGPSSSSATCCRRSAAERSARLRCSKDDGNWNLENIASTAEITADAARLSGTKTLVCDAAVADFVLVSVSLAGAPALAIVRAARSSARAQDAGDRHR